MDGSRQLFHRQAPFIRLNPPTDDSLFGATIYQKGGSIVHTLREEIGDDAFWKGVNLYLNKHKFANVETNDLKTAMEEASGTDLTWFFDQWVYKAGYPKITVNQIYHAAKKSLIITITQTQKVNSITPSAFVLPLDLEIETAQGTNTEKIKVEKRIQTFTFKTDDKPTKLLFDKDLKIPLKSIKIMP